MGFMGRMPGWMVPAREDAGALVGSEGAECAASSAPGGGGVVAHLLPMNLGGRVEPGDALLRSFGGLEFGNNATASA